MAFDRFDNLRGAEENLKNIHQKLTLHSLREMGGCALDPRGGGSSDSQSEVIPADLASDWHARTAAGQTPVAPEAVRQARLDGNEAASQSAATPGAVHGQANFPLIVSVHY